MYICRFIADNRSIEVSELSVAVYVYKHASIPPFMVQPDNTYVYHDINAHVSYTISAVCAN